MSNENFLRRYSLKCGKNGSSGFQIGNYNDARDTALHVSFNVEKSNAENPNDAKVQIWNLSDRNLKLLECEDCIVELKAGYEDNMALILIGCVTSATTTKDGADRMTELTVVDGRIELRDTTISVSINGKVNAKEIYQRIANAMGMPIVFANDLVFNSVPNGFSYVGKAKNALHKIANYCGHSWTIQNQILQITWPGRPIATRAYVLSDSTGLISIPKRITIGSGKEAQTGWEVEYFLNGAIGVNDIVQLKSLMANGYFLVHKVTFNGDNLEGDWICTAQLLEIKAQPKLDKIASSAPGAATIKKGDKVKVIRTLNQSGRTKGYQYSGGTFVCWYSTYDVIQVTGDRVVIGIGSTVTAAVNINDVQKV